MTARREVSTMHSEVAIASDGDEDDGGSRGTGAPSDDWRGGSGRRGRNQTWMVPLMSTGAVSVRPPLRPSQRASELLLGVRTKAR